MHTTMQTHLDEQGDLLRRDRALILHRSLHATPRCVMRSGEARQRVYRQSRAAGLNLQVSGVLLVAIGHASASVLKREWSTAVQKRSLRANILSLHERTPHKCTHYARPSPVEKALMTALVRTGRL
jgi:hypothetical protein